MRGTWLRASPNIIVYRLIIGWPLATADSNNNMGLMQLVGQTQKIGTAVCHIPSITALVLGVFASLFTIVTLNILKQALVKRSHEPPLVFHWAPFVGNAVEYGQDPYAFLFECRRKVSQH